MSVLILGGTADARRLAELFVDQGIEAITSLAGRTRQPVEVAGRTRTGGFGGSEGLSSWLVEHRIAAVIDATHPFAAAMTDNASAAAQISGVPLLLWRRPGWSDHRLADTWQWVADHDQAARTAQAVQAASAAERTIFLTIGRQHVADYVQHLQQHQVLARVAEPPEATLPGHWRILVDRGPFRQDQELDLMDRERVGTLVTKDSGGSHTEAKLWAAEQRGVSVIMITRPSVPEGIPATNDPAEALQWVRTQLNEG